MIVRLKRVLTHMVLMTAMLTALTSAVLAEQQSEYSAALFETPLQTTETGETICKLTMSVQGFVNTKTISLGMIYDQTVITPIRAAAYKNEGAIEPLSAPGEEMLCIPDEAAAGFTIGEVTMPEAGLREEAGFYAVLSKDGFIGADLTQGEAVLEWYYMVSDMDALHRLSIRLPESDEELEWLNDQTYSVAAIQIVAQDSKYAGFHLHSQFPAADTVAPLSATLTYTNCNADVLTATEIVPQEPLMLVVPDRATGSSTLQLAVENTGLTGPYTGGDAVTTWSVDDLENTGAVVDPSTGQVRVTNKSNAGTITVDATTTAGNVTLTDQVTVEITKAPPVLSEVALSEEAVLVNGSGSHTVTAAAQDQYGDPVPEAISWSISSTDPDHVTIDPETGQITVQGMAKGGTVTVTAQGAEKSAWTTLDIQRAEPTAQQITLSQEPVHLVVPADDGQVQSQLSATVIDQYGEMLQSPEIVWSITKDGVSVSGVTMVDGVISVTKAAAEAVPSAEPVVFTVTATCGSAAAEREITIARSAPVATSVRISKNNIPLGETDTVVLPPAGGEPRTVHYAAVLYDQYGTVMEADPVWSLLDETVPDHVTFENGVLTVSDGAAAGTEVIMEAVVEGVHRTLTVTIADLQVDWSAVDEAITDKGLTYGQTNSQLAQLPTIGTATVLSEEVTGTLMYLDGDTVQPAGMRQVTVVFTVTTDGPYEGLRTYRIYDVEIAKKAITVHADDQTKEYGQPLPELTVSIPEGALVPGDRADALSVHLTTTATERSNVGDYSISGTATAENYTVTVTGGTLHIIPATVTITIPPLAGTMTANDANNTVDGLRSFLPGSVPISGAGTAATTAAIVWSNAAESYDPKGGMYTYVGTLAANDNFANRPTVTATMTVLPVSVTAMGPLPETLTISANQVRNAETMDVLGIPDSIQLTFDQNVAALSIAAVWDTTLEQLQAAAADVTEQQDKTVMLTLLGDTIPVWATVNMDLPTVTVILTHKQVIPEGDITFAPMTVTYGQPYAPQASVDAAVYPGASYTYTYNGGTAMPTKAGVYSITVTVETPDYKGVKTTRLTIAPKPLVQEMIQPINGNFIYNGSPHKPDILVMDGEKSLLAGTDYAVSYTDNILAGEAVLTIAGQGNYTGTVSVPFVIQKAALSAWVPVLSGNAQVGSVLTARLDGVAAEEYTWRWYRDEVELPDVMGSTYTLTTLDSSSAITVQAVAAEKNYTGHSQVSDSIQVGKQTITGTVTISADGPEIIAGSILTAHIRVYPQVDVTYQWYLDGTAVEGAVQSTFVVPEHCEGKAIFVQVMPVSGEFQGSIISEAVTVGKFALRGSLTVTRGEGEAANTLYALLTDGLELAHCDLVWLRNGQEIPGATGQTYTITKEDKGTTITVLAVGKGAYSGTIQAEGVAIPATVPDAPTVTASAGNGKADIRWTVPHDGGAPITGYLLTIRMGATTVAVVELTPNTTAYTANNLINGTTYTFAVTVVNAVGSSLPGTAEATPKAPDGGGTSGGGTGTDQEHGQTVINPDGSTTTTVINPDGSRTETTTMPDGSSFVVTTDKDGQVTIQVTVSDSAVANAGDTVVLPIPPVSVTADRTAATAITVDLPGGGTAKVEIPVDHVTAGTVAIIVKADGTEVIDKTTVLTKDSVIVTLSTGDTVKIVDNSKEFQDVPGDFWSAEVVDFVSARELFVGTGASKFSFHTEMSAGMLVTVLARLEGVDTTTGSTWYEAGQLWAAAHGIWMDADMERSLTREEVVIMLYRHAGMPVVQGNISGFADADKVSDAANDAMTWATENGIVIGSNGKLRPQDAATRGEAAAMLMRYICAVQ